jgi:hypothetical protein
MEVSDATLFAYLEGDKLYTLEGELTGRLEGEFIVDVVGNRVWRVVGDGVYTLDLAQSIGYLGQSVSRD